MVHARALTKLFSYHVAAMHELGAADNERAFSLQSTTAMNAQGLMLMKQEVRETGHAKIALMYDVDGHMPKLERVWTMMPSTDPAALARGEDLTLLVDCKLWAPANDGPIIVIAPEGYGGHFAVSADGTRLEHRVAKPARQLEAGMRRARQRIARAARIGVGQAKDGTVLLAVA